VANLELERLDGGEQFTVQLSKEEFQQLQLKAGEEVFVELKNVKPTLPIIPRFPIWPNWIPMKSVPEIIPRPTWNPSRIDPIINHVGENVSFVQTNYNDGGWQQINLPHDWVVGLPFSSSADLGHGFKSGISGYTSPTTSAGIGTPSRCPPRMPARPLWLEFDGVYRNCLVWLNGHIHWAGT
jgi:hypothetical protein